jgi:signal transduction histidine kinase
VLSDHGLAPAVQVLVQRTPVPVDAEVSVAERLPAPVEAAAYFLVAEALTNVAKYAGAASAEVRIAREGDELRVMVSDDGIGGARIDGGSGLRGLSDRLAALEGTLALLSPEGGGTRVEARIPL